jgi:hypothetical protein
MRSHELMDERRIERHTGFRPRGGSHLRAISSLFALLALLALPSAPLERIYARGAGAEWPQLGGPTRSFRVPAAPIARSWPEAGPRQRWRRPLGEGYSSVLVDGTTLVTMYRKGDAEVVVALDSATGSTRWEHAYSAPLTHNGYFDVSSNAAGPGPYSTPLWPMEWSSPLASPLAIPAPSETSGPQLQPGRITCAGASPASGKRLDLGEKQRMPVGHVTLSGDRVSLQTERVAAPRTRAAATCDCDAVGCG